MTDDDLISSLPCAEALVAGTVAAMTAWADPCPTCPLGPEGQRRLLARKLVSNLCLLTQHPGLSPELRQVMALAHQRWVGLLDRSAGPDADTRVLAAGPVPAAGRWH